MKAIALRSVDSEPKPEDIVAPVVEPEIETTKDSVIARIPLPSRLEEKKKWDEDEFLSFLNLFKTLLIELIEKVPKYA
ncbi:hypothetical protein EPI10_016468 [Gossypium australe]|uniref:Uncharacterized protein n=1 Tax=Gossypium australe TaxID=47621 RepID=A0A5B6VP23_9ROSI|nr:hypothetical protein EPI10_016468 [Gossypium australe]